MIELIGPRITEPFHDFKEHLEVEVLLVPDHPDHALRVIILELLQGGADILCDVDAGAVAAEHNLLAELAEVAEDRSILSLRKDAFFQPRGDDILAEQIGFALQVGVVEVNPHALVGLRESGEHPAVHHLPELADRRIAGLPILQHLLGGAAEFGFEEQLLAVLVRQFRPGGLQCLDLLRKRLVVFDVELSDQMITLHAGRLRRAAVAEPLVRDHRLADVDAPVVDQVDFDHVVTDPLQQRSQRHAERIVAHVTEVLRLVGVRGGKLDQDAFALRLRQLCGFQQPFHRRHRIAMQRTRLHRHIHKGLDHFDAFDVRMPFQKLRDGRRRLHRVAAEAADPEAVQREIAGHSRRAGFHRQRRFRRILFKLVPQKIFEVDNKLIFHDSFQS